jgi:NaMN:DMB phosphoribosyltransferase
MSTPARTRPTEGPAPRAAGREHGLALARAALAEAAARHPRVLLVLAEAGMGKTTLAEALAGESRLAGWTVVWSRNAASGEPFRPWRRVVRDLRAARGDAPAFDEALACLDGQPRATPPTPARTPSTTPA